jgi:1-acyl-sn-glycerol-3-phosphate acyltransferase
MHNVIIDEPYRFIPPYRGKLWAWVFRSFYLGRFLRKSYGIKSWRIEGLDRLRASLGAGHGILLCPNHCRPSDPMLMGLIVRETPCYIYAMASWHIFKQSPLEGYIANRVGGFSVYREGLDRQSLDTSIDIVASAERPLVIFPEGVISRANDRLLTLMDGVSFVARMAAKKRAKMNPAGKVVIHPMSIRYQLTGDLNDSVSPVLSRLEQRTFWKTHEYLPLRQRIAQLGQALLAAREIECLGQPQSGSLSCRMARLIDAVLHPQEQEWLGQCRSGDVISRVKDLRIAMLPEILGGNLPDDERQRRWRQLTDSYYLQCLSMYPPQYLDDGIRGKVTAERYAETVHRLEEDMTDQVSIRPEWHVTIRIGDPIEVDATQKRVRNGPDPLMESLRRDMLGLLEIEDWWPPTQVTLAGGGSLPASGSAATHNSDS